MSIAIDLYYRVRAQTTYSPVGGQEAEITLLAKPTPEVYSSQGQALSHLSGTRTKGGSESKNGNITNLPLSRLHQAKGKEHYQRVMKDQWIEQKFQVISDMPLNLGPLPLTHLMVKWTLGL